jgi:hypothetical protein
MLTKHKVGSRGVWRFERTKQWRFVDAYAAGFGIRHPSNIPTLFAFQNPVVPPGNPSLAVGADVWNASFSGGSPSPGAPQLGPIIHQGQNGDTVTVGGVFASTTTFLVFGQTTGGNPTISPLTVGNNGIRRITSNRAVLSFPSSLPANSMYLVYAVDSNGRQSYPLAVNQTETWWLNALTTGNANVIVGDTVNSFGRNLCNNLAYPYTVGNPANGCLFYLTATYGGILTNASPACTAINPYRASFVMPALYASTTSTSTITFPTPSIGGTISFTTATDQSGAVPGKWQVGMPIIVWNTHGGMWGTVATISGTSVTATIYGSTTSNYATGTFSSWTIDPCPSVNCYVHNGHGGQYGWSQPLTIKIVNKVFPKSNYGTDDFNACGINYDALTINLPAPHSPPDTTGATDTANILAMFTSGNTPSVPFTLVPQAGTYWINNSINLAGNYGVGGKVDGTGVAAIFKASSTFNDTSQGSNGGGRFFYSGSTNNAELNNITVDCTLVTNGTSYSQSLGTFNTNQATCACNRIFGCTLTYPFPLATLVVGAEQSISNVGFTNPSSLIMQNTTLTGMGVGFSSCIYALIDNCHFYMTSLEDAAVFLGGLSGGCQMTNNKVQHLTPGGDIYHTGHGRLMYGSCGSGLWHNFYGAGNSTNSTRFDNTSGFGDGEFFVVDGVNGLSSSLATAADSTHVTITDTASAGWIGTALVAITGGTGIGQSRLITGVSGNQLTVDIPWDIIPDFSGGANTSNINVINSYDRMVVYNNTGQGGNILSDGSAQGDSKGVNVFGGGTNIIVDGNSWTDMNVGVDQRAFGDISGGGNPSTPIFFNLVQNNAFDHCNYGILSAPFAVHAGTAEQINFMGNAYRNNTFTNMVAAGRFITNVGLIDLDVFQSSSFSTALAGGTTANSPNGILLLGSNGVIIGNLQLTLVDTTMIGNGTSGSVGLPTGYAGHIGQFGTSIGGITGFASGNA